MWLKWFPWRFLVSRLARAYGFMDPVVWLTRMRNFAPPSEVTEPVELLRAGALFHARGLINTRAIQHNLDWIWPYWVERQFNPADRSFIPRAFSFSHINLTHRNWTAVGLPNVPYYSIVDPRGLVTPYYDGWSLDFWLIGPGDRWLVPAKLEQAAQHLEAGDNLHVISHFALAGWQLATDVWMEQAGAQPECVIRVTAQAPPEVRLAVVVRPYNPEGISFIDSIARQRDPQQLLVNKYALLHFSRVPERTLFSAYRQGDVAHAIERGPETKQVACAVSMASGAALFSIDPQPTEPLEVRVTALDPSATKDANAKLSPGSWRKELNSCSRLQIPDRWWQQLYEIAVSSLILHTPGEVYPGPYTYKRFWYRDAAFILNALVSLGGHERTRQALDRFSKGQTLAGYFRSQDGEWDSNGEALWIMNRYLRLTGQELPPAWRKPAEQGAQWIITKRLPKNLSAPHAGLLPPGFSAEHLGPNDYYYWDDFWAVAGLRAAANMLGRAAPPAAVRFSAAAGDFFQTIVRSFQFLPEQRGPAAIPASPYRRMDSGAVGSLVADYPLQLFPPGHERVINTTEYLLAHCLVDGGFFQNVVHSGINPYLTLHLAQVLLRMGDPRAFTLVETVARLASSTGQWPEAIHPHTQGGCMGDGQHIWAAAEWTLIIRNFFVREEGGGLVVGAGLLPRWLDSRQPLSFGPTLTPFGAVSVHLDPVGPQQWRLLLEGQWRGDPPPVEVRVPGAWRSTKAHARHIFDLRKDS